MLWKLPRQVSIVTLSDGGREITQGISAKSAELEATLRGRAEALTQALDSARGAVDVTLLDGIDGIDEGGLDAQSLRTIAGHVEATLSEWIPFVRTLDGEGRYLRLAGTIARKSILSGSVKPGQPAPPADGVTTLQSVTGLKGAINRLPATFVLAHPAS